MPQKRNAKKGYVYLLKDVNDEEGKTYKFGCTTLNPEKRCKRVNYEYREKGNKFKLICSFKSFDIYADESKVRSDILLGGFGFLSELINIDLDESIKSERDLIDRFLFIGEVLAR